jgi:hypothetical protein
MALNKSGILAVIVRGLGVHFHIISFILVELATKVERIFVQEVAEQLIIGHLSLLVVVLFTVFSLAILPFLQVLQ